MIKNYDTILKYRQQYPEDQCAWMEPSNFVFVDNGKRVLLSPREETDEIFLDRLERSKACGRNLFFEEWIDEFNPEPGVQY